ncbi:MAG: 30S ribosomal protein S20 [Bacteroidota bacterium]
MPQHKSAIKRVRQNEKRRVANRDKRSKMRTLIKRVMEATDKEDAQEKFRKASSFLDRQATKNLIHPNKAAREKARMSKHVNNL